MENSTQPDTTPGLSKARKFWNGVDITLRLLMVAGVLMLFLFGVYKLHNWRTRQNIEKYLEPYARTDTIILTRLNRIKSSRQLTEEEKAATLYMQYKILTARKAHHQELASYFISNYYASLLVVLFASIGGGIVIFLIATKGWGKTSNYIKVSFLSLVFMAAFYAIFPNVFGQKQNFESNLAAFIKYDNLQFEIFNFMSVRQEVDSLGNSITTDSMITYINNRIIELNNMYISTDNAGIREINEMFQSAKSKEMPPIPRAPAEKSPADTPFNP